MAINDQKKKPDKKPDKKTPIYGDVNVFNV